MKLAVALAATLLLGTGATASATEASSRIVSVAWAPDGRWIAYVRDDYGPAPAEVRVVRTDGTGDRRILRQSTRLSLAWSPDSRRLAISDYQTTWIAALVGSPRQVVGSFGDW